MRAHPLMAKLKILIYGESWEWAMAHNLGAAFVELGHDVVQFDHTRRLYRSRSPSLLNRALDRILARQVTRRINEDFCHALDAARWDLVVILKGVHLLPDSIRHALTRSALVVNWNPDDFFNPLNSTAGLLGSFPLYHRIFTPRRHLTAEYLRRGARAVTHMGWYYLPSFQYPDRDGASCPAAAFIGTWSRRRECLLDTLRDVDLRVHGACWYKARRAFKARVAPGAPLYMDQLRRILGGAKISINILTVENRDTTNIRNFEIPACSGFQLSERSEDILELFEEGREIACFSGPEELLDKCRYYLAHDEERRRIAAGGRRRLTAGRHTMRDRAEDILSALSLD